MREIPFLKIHAILSGVGGRGIAVTKSNSNDTAYNPTSGAELAREKLV